MGKQYQCGECFWQGEIKTTQEPNENRRAVENTDIEHCPVCGRWGI